eukprot:3888679-Prymnesium_polylepis.1
MRVRHCILAGRPDGPHGLRRQDGQAVELPHAGEGTSTLGRRRAAACPDPRRPRRAVALLVRPRRDGARATLRARALPSRARRAARAVHVHGPRAVGAGRRVRAQRQDDLHGVRRQLRADLGARQGRG